MVSSFYRPVDLFQDNVTFLELGYSAFICQVIEMFGLETA